MSEAFDERPTPRASSAFQRAGAFMELSRDLSQRLETEALRREKVLGASFDPKLAREMRSLGRKATILVGAFESWFNSGEIDYDRRLDDIKAYHDLVKQAAEIGVFTYDT